MQGCVPLFGNRGRIEESAESHEVYHFSWNIYLNNINLNSV